MTWWPTIATKAADSASIDAFSRMRVSELEGIFDSSFQHDLHPLVFSTSASVGGTLTHTSAYSSCNMTVSAATGSTAILSTKQYFKYQPGRSHLLFMTQIVGAAASGVVKRIGYFDANNGIFLEQNGVTDLAIVRRTSTSGGPADNRVTQANWNLDPLNGSGASKITLDLSKASILVIDLQWLGMGRVRVGFDIDGVIYYAHQFLNANVLTVPYMTTANLPIRWEMVNSAALASATMYATCCSLNSEGGYDEQRGYQFGQATSASFSAGNNTRTHGLSVRKANTLNSVSTRGINFILLDFSIVVGSTAVLVELMYNPTLSGGSWVAVDSSNSAVEYNVTSSYTSGGVVITSFVAAASTNQVKSAASKDFSLRIPVCVDSLTGTQYPLSLIVTGLGGASTCYVAMSWREVR